MARLQVAHGISRAAPPDGHLDAASTPIRAILFPKHSARRPDDEGFTRCERRLSNAVVRPNGLYYFGALCLVLALPTVLLLLKPPTTLESLSTTYLLFGCLSVCSVLISGTTIQFVYYWFALKQVLERILVHPLARHFSTLPETLQRPIDRQLSDSSGDLLRLCASAQELCAALKRVDGADAMVSELDLLRKSALGAEGARPEPDAESARPARAPSDRLLFSMIKAAGVLEAVRATTATQESPANRGAPSVEERVADQRAHAILGVVSLLVGRHVLQFRHFLYTSTSCVLLLLLAISSYAFQPRRVLMSFIWSLTSLVVITGLYIFVQLARSRLLNSVAGTPNAAGKLEWNRDVLARVVVFAVLPLLGLLAAQYPDFAAELSRVWEPYARTLR